MFPAARKRTVFVRPLLIACRMRSGEPRPADSDAENEDAHVLDARVGEHPLEVALADHEDRGDGHGEEAEGDEQAAREGPFARRAHDSVDAQEREEGAARQPSGEERADEPGRLAVGVRLPGVKRRQAHLRAVADEEEDEGRPEPGSREAAGVLAKRSRRGATARPPRDAPNRPGREMPRSASAMPTEPIIRYFHVASMRARVPG